MFKSIQPALLDVPVITPVFQDWSGGKYKVLAFHAKRARGLMTRYIAVNGITQAEELKAFDSEGYDFDETASTESALVFRRKK